MSLAVRRTLVAGLLTLTLGCALTIAAPAAPAGAKVGLHATDGQLANEFLQLLKAKDMRGLARFLDPAFLLQRADGSYLTKAQYLQNPAVVNDYTVSNVFGTRRANVRVVRYTVVTDQIINGQKVTADPVSRLSTYVRHGRTWRLISHANFIAPPPPAS
ncbi:nuclear transport factor 2 family protein [Capillimicrobium parvum]|uniref:DUF4440 domain-containing protein n=1 Tax=Capillimicrobium parvum TaxID=2884022 RepID=A0A9E7BYZ4_9ACTN|nr:nuclear transport factor 2 family protein [Capillimicrobium parvum]UGS34755.1 hypothetical protein DSM104329_01137 [Capillimicrobium parvum]